MKATVAETLHQASSFFIGASDIPLAANRITKELDAMGIPFAVAGPNSFAVRLGCSATAWRTYDND